MILCIGATPAIQRVMVFRRFLLDEVNRATTTLEGAAGKAVNVAKVLKSLGEHPMVAGFLGGDRGQAIRMLLGNLRIDAEFLNVDAPTRQCVTVIDEAAQTQTELVEESGPVAAAAYDELAAIIQRRMKTARAAIMSGTLTPGGPSDFYRNCVRTAREAGALSVVDAQGQVFMEALSERPGLVKPNRKELIATFGREQPGESALMEMVREVCARGAERAVVTAGKEPTLAFDGRNFWRITSPSVRVLNPIGSGDAFTAGLVWRLLRGDDLAEACRWGSACGTANALTLMPGDIAAEEVARLAAEVRIAKA
jgi:tagatose 6-phosphate kinase